MNEPTQINDGSHHLSRSRSKYQLLTQSPYTKPHLREISRLFHSPASRIELSRLLSERENLEPFITACTNERKLGRDVLRDIVLVWPGLLRQLVIHDMFLNSNPAIRISCLECLIDLLESSTGPQYPATKTPLTRKSLDILEKRFLDDVNKNDSGNFTKPNRRARLRGNSPKANVIKSKKAPAQSPSSSCTSESYCDGTRKSNRDTRLPLSHSDKADSDLQGWADGFLSTSSLSKWFRPEDESSYSEDFPPVPKKSSEDWFFTTTQNDFNNSYYKPQIMSCSRLSFEDFPNKILGKKVIALSKPSIMVSSTYSSSDESISELTRSSQIQEEEEWFRNTRPIAVSTNEVHQSILKKTTMALKKPFAGARVSDTSKNAYMHSLMDFGVLVALGDLASLDPETEPQKIAERALRLTLENAPDSLLTKLPKTYGYFLRNHRQLCERRPTRPKHLNRAIRSLMRKVNGDLNGCTLLLGVTTGIYVQRLTTYFQCYCSQSAHELVVSTHHDAIAHARLYPGFSDIHYRLANHSTVGFHVKQEYKEYDPRDNPNLLTRKAEKVEDDANNLSLMFGVDGTNLQSDLRLKFSFFDRIVWNLPQAGWSHRSITKKMLIAKFLSGVKDILTSNGTVQLTLPKETFSHSASGLTNLESKSFDIKTVLEASSFRLVKTKDVPKSLFLAHEVDNEFSSATVYFLKLESAPDSEESYCDSWYEDE